MGGLLVGEGGGGKGYVGPPPKLFGGGGGGGCPLPPTLSYAYAMHTSCHVTCNIAIRRGKGFEEETNNKRIDITIASEK